MVDVILCCYNQEATITQAVQSIFSQKTSETINLIVADDASSDATVVLINEVAHREMAKCHEIVDLGGVQVSYLQNSENLGMCRNYQRAFQACNSDFVFILEGDDFWEPNHIEQHIQFLSRHPSCSMSMNRLTIIKEGNREEVRGYENRQEKKRSIPYKILRKLYRCTLKKYLEVARKRKDSKEYKTWTLREQILGNRLGNLSGCCFRGKFIRALPNRLFEISFADWLLGMIMAEYGDIAVLKESTSTYRIHLSGQWSGFSDEQKQERMLNSAKIYNAYFDNKYRKYFKKLARTLGGDI